MKRRPRPRRPRRAPRSAPEELFALHVRVARLPAPEREYRFHPERRWRLDFAWPQHRVAVEVEGGVWTGGRHIRGAGFTKDCEKYAEAAVLGWRVIRVTPEHVASGLALRWVTKLLDVATATAQEGGPP